MYTRPVTSACSPGWLRSTIGCARDAAVPEAQTAAVGSGAQAADFARCEGVDQLLRGAKRRAWRPVAAFRALRRGELAAGFWRSAGCSRERGDAGKQQPSATATGEHALQKPGGTERVGHESEASSGVVGSRVSIDPIPSRP